MATTQASNLDDAQLKTDLKTLELEGCETNGEETISRIEGRRILRRIDLHLLPIMAVSYLFQFLDKAALGYTAILGLNTDLNLTGQDFSWASAIYYIGYLVASYPAGWLIVRYPVAKVITGSVLLWGAVLMLTATCFNAETLLVTRFFLGALESTVGPGLTVIIAMWYTRSEQPLRMGAWYLGNVIAGMAGGLIAYGIGRVESIAPWKAVFLVFGAMTVSWSVVIFFFLPDTPMNAKFLNEQDRTKAVKRVEENKTGIKDNTWKLSQAIEATLDIKIWLLVIIQTATNVANGGVQSFSSILIKGFGFSTLNTLLVQVIAFAFQGIFILIACCGSSYLKNTRTYFIAANLAISIVGSVMIREIDASQKWTRFFGYCINMAFTANLPVVLSMVSSNVAGFTKKTTANSMLFIAYCLGNVIGPQLFLAKESPRYQTGFLSILICYAIGICSCIVLRVYLIAVNKRRDRLNGDNIDLDESGIVSDSGDKTDKEQLTFRYVY